MKTILAQFHSIITHNCRNILYNDFNVNVTAAMRIHIRIVFLPSIIQGAEYVAYGY